MDGRMESNHESPALAAVAQWTKHQPVNRKVAGSIPSQGTRLGCGHVLNWGYVRGKQSMFLFLSFSSLLLKINKY